MKSVLVFIVGILAFVYLINPTAGLLEFLPDNIPGVGNLDEATATFLLLSVLSYFGFDVSHLFQKKKSPAKTINTAEYDNVKK